MAQWSNFYMLIGEASATLMGLMFIAVTFGSKLVTPESAPLVRSYFSSIFYHFIHAFFIACIALVPDEGVTAFCIIVVVISVVRLLIMPYTMIQLKRSEKKSGQFVAYDWALTIAIPTVVYILFCLFCFICLFGDMWALKGISALAAGLLILGVVTAWDTLIWMASQI